MTINLSSRNFSLTIAGVTRTNELSSITLSQPSTLERRDAPRSGSITLTFNPLRYNEFITIGDPVTAANWAVGAAVVFQTSNDSGTLVNWFTGFILKEPSPPNIGFNEGTLQIDVGDILAYQSQRTADTDVSGVTIGTNTDRDDIVIRVQEDAGITSYSIPSLNYPFNTPIQKTGGSPIKFAGDLVGADRHVLYCNASGTVIASPIDIAATAIATLTIGQDEASFDPVDGSSIPTVTELTIAGVVQIPDQGDYPILVTNESSTVFVNPFTSFMISKVTKRNTIYSQSENLLINQEELLVNGLSTGVSVGLIAFGFSGLYFGSSYTQSYNVKSLAFDTQNRLSKETEITYVQRYKTGVITGTSVAGIGVMPIIKIGLPQEITRKETSYIYALEGYISTILKSEYKSAFPLITFDPSGNELQSTISLFLQNRETITFNPKGSYWVKETIPETTFTLEDSRISSSTITKTLNVNGVDFQVLGFNDATFKILNRQEGSVITRTTSGFVTTIEVQGQGSTNRIIANDGSTRPPSITYSEAAKTKNKEVKATVNAIPLGGVPSKEKRQPLLVDWLTSDAHALEYGQLEIVLINGRKQCRFMVTALTDALLNLRPRSRIDIIFNGILYRCLADAIAFSQDLTKRSIGFMCDVISTSPAATPSTVYRPVTVANSIRCIAQASPATAAISANIAFDVIFAQCEPATAAIDIGVNVSATITAQCEPATAIISSTFTP